MKYLLPSLFFLLFFPIASSAASIAIGQIQSEGTSANDEYVEVVNDSGETVSLGNWSIQYKSVNGSTFYKKNFTKDASIAANGKYVACGAGYAGACDMRHSSFALSSAGGTVFLVSDQVLLASTSSSAIIDQKIYGPTDKPKEETPEDLIPPSPYQEEGAAMVPKQESLRLVINEFMSAPTEGDEWVELYNPTGYAVELSGWTLSDGTGKTFQALEDLIAPAGFKLIEMSSSRLNDSGDLIILRDKSGAEVDKVAYGDWPSGDAKAPVGTQGISVARIGDGVDTDRDNENFALTGMPTPGMPNCITATDEKSQITTTKLQKNSNDKILNSKTDLKWLADLIADKNGELAELLKTNKNIVIVNNVYIGTDAGASASTKSQAPNSQPVAKQTITKTAQAKTTAASSAKTTNAVEGQIIAPVGLTGKDMAIVREANRSVEVRLPKDLETQPSVGDLVQASGTWSTAKTLTLPRLLVKTATAFSVTGREETPPPLGIALTDADAHIGEIVKAEGVIVEKQPTRFRIAADDGSALIKEAYAAQKGDRVSVTGLLAKSDEDFIMSPLSPNAIAIINPPAQPKPFTKKAAPYALALVPAGLLTGSIYFGRRYGKWKGGESP